MPEGDTFDFECEVCPFASRGWSSEQKADQRGEQHMAEHKTNEPMPELVDFLNEKGA